MTENRLLKGGKSLRAMPLQWLLVLAPEHKRRVRKEDECDGAIMRTGGF